MTDEHAIDLQIGGMTSRESATDLERALASLSGVQRALVSYGTRRGRVIVDPSAELLEVEARLIETIEGQGYQATTISRAR